jgi:hypothetical protein
MNGIIRALIVAALPALLTGCGPSGSTVSGTVTFKDQPVDWGTVTFLVGPTVVDAEIKADGTYVAQNVPSGTAKVAVRSRIASKVEVDLKERAEKRKLPPPAAATPRGAVLPLSYGDFATSALEVNVNQKEMAYNIKLVDRDE